MGFDVYGASGNYFRANCWSWRPIMALIEEANQELELGNLETWHYNDGAGLKTQANCDRLADALEKLTGPKHQHVLEFADCSLRVGPKTGIFQDKGVTPYSTDGEHVLKFVKFLRECGGSFEIW